MNLIQIQKLADGSFSLHVWGDNSDGSSNIIKYESVDDLLKVSPLLAKELSGNSRDSDFIQIWLNQDGSINRLNSHVFSESKDEAPQIATVPVDKLDASSLTVFDSLKADIEVKFPKPIVILPPDPTDLG